jgi:hypothetical protein
LENPRAPAGVFSLGGPLLGWAPSRKASQISLALKQKNLGTAVRIVHFGHGPMSRADEYRANAQECERMAASSRNNDDRVTWLQMAAHWLRMIPRGSSDSERFDALQASKGTHQKRSESSH